MVIRTNGGKLTVNAPNDHMEHFGTLDFLQIDAIKTTASYVENGYTAQGQIKEGRVVNTEGTIEVDGETKAAGVDNLFIETNATGDGFGTVVVASQDGADLPTLDRGEVTIGDGVLVVEVQEYSGSNKTSDEFIWLFGDGTVEAEKVVVTSSSEKPSVETFDLDTSTKSGKAGEQIANVPGKAKASKEDVAKGTTLFAGGAGTENNPYLIANDTQFANIESLYVNNQPISGHFKLVADIRYEGDTMDEVKDFVLDGDNHKLTFKGSKGGLPSLFTYTCGGTNEIKNLNYELDGLLKCLFGYVNRDSEGYQVGTTKFTNILVTSTTDDMIESWGYGASPYGYCFGSATYFENCINDLNYQIGEDAGYAGCFVGNYGFKGSYVSFVNCENKGNVSGAYIGFFYGNDTYKPLVTTSKTPVFDKNGMTIYIENNRNTGTIIGAKRVSAFGCNQNSTAANTADSLVDESQLIRGKMLVGGIEDIGIEFTDYKLSLVGSANANVASYSLGYYAEISFKNNGSSRISIQTNVSKTEVESGKEFAKVAKFVSKKDYEKSGGNYYTLGEEKLAGQFLYKVATDSNGMLIIVVNIERDDFNLFSQPEYSVSAYNSNGIKIGYVEY